MPWLERDGWRVQAIHVLIPEGDPHDLVSEAGILGPFILFSVLLL